MANNSTSHQIPLILSVLDTTAVSDNSDHGIRKDEKKRRKDEYMGIRCNDKLNKDQKPQNIKK